MIPVNTPTVGDVREALQELPPGRHPAIIYCERPIDEQTAEHIVRLSRQRDAARRERDQMESQITMIRTRLLTMIAQVDRALEGQR